jgi:hypothetical protein
MIISTRLPPSKLKTERYRELFEAIEEYWAQNNTANLIRLRNLRSVFTASDDDLNRIIDEMSAYFEETADDVSKPLSIYWKQSEIDGKASLRAFDAMVQRIKVSTKNIELLFLYAPKDLVAYPYGTLFYRKEEILHAGGNLSDYFLTSHVTIRIDFAEILEQEWDETELRYTVERYYEENIRPTNIVFIGVNYYVLAKNDGLIFLMVPQTRETTITVET